MEKYKVLSVRQPYASLLVNGIKDVENRSRYCRYRGTLLIHASTKEHEVLKTLRKQNKFSSVDIDTMVQMDEVDENDLYGCIIGSVEVVDCVVDSKSEWAMKGCYHIVCKNEMKFEHPIRNVKGKLGIWEWEGDIELYK